MKRSVAISFTCHAALLGFALFGLGAPKPFEVKPPEAIQVDISSIISDKTQKTAQTKDPTPPAEKPAPKKTEVTKDVPPAPKVDEKVNDAAREPKAPPPEKKPEPPKPKPEEKPLDSDPLKQLLADEAAKEAEQQKIEEKKKLDEQKKVEAKKKAEELKKAEEKKKADQKKKLDNALADAQSLLNKKLGEKTAPAKTAETTGAPKQTDKEQQGSDGADTATLTAALVAKVKQCFNIPASAREANISVPIHFMLNTDGSVMGIPEIEQGGGDPVFDATARAAISAIMECQNYDLPADQYEQWKDNVLDFNPKELAG